MTLTVDIPESAFSVLRIRPKDYVQSMIIAATVKWYELGKLSQAKAAEICNVSRAEFINILSDYKVSIVQYDEQTLDAELKSE